MYMAIESDFPERCTSSQQLPDSLARWFHCHYAMLAQQGKLAAASGLAISGFGSSSLPGGLTANLESGSLPAGFMLDPMSKGIQHVSVLQQQARNILQALPAPAAAAVAAAAGVSSARLLAAEDDDAGEAVDGGLAAAAGHDAAREQCAGAAGAAEEHSVYAAGGAAAAAAAAGSNSQQQQQQQQQWGGRSLQPFNPTKAAFGNSGHNSGYY
ncbi:hypothetical protein COO60DRAFT_131968 [Scenedesmus sp. NREL 46B-D3]|nr:hypothetical protein COO60DRAFT_131968 [Scenedesmus sp. NREL 46B-D3]